MPIDVVGGAGINDEFALSWIQECVSSGKYHVTDHALTKHTLAEGFRVRDALTAISRGSIIESRLSECRCVICGDVPGLRLHADFISNYIHCVVQWDEVEQVVIITMYRPRSDQWVNQFTRRRSPC